VVVSTLTCVISFSSDVSKCLLIRVHVCLQSSRTEVFPAGAGPDIGGEENH
jgi:hypothetical protein